MHFINKYRIVQVNMKELILTNKLVNVKYLKKLIINKYLKMNYKKL